MTAKPRIRIDLIDQAQQALHALPQHQPDEVTKSQAIQRLLPQIRESQSKGYSLAAIGKVLTERGIPITTGALRAYVSSGTSRAGGKKKPRRVQPRAEATPSVPPPVAPKVAATTVRATPSKAAEPSRKANAGADLDWDAAARSEKIAPAPSYHGFVPRPDTDLKDL